MKNLEQKVIRRLIKRAYKEAQPSRFVFLTLIKAGLIVNKDIVSAQKALDILDFVWLKIFVDPHWPYFGLHSDKSPYRRRLS